MRPGAPRYLLHLSDASGHTLTVACPTALARALALIPLATHLDVTVRCDDDGIPCPDCARRTTAAETLCAACADQRDAWVSAFEVRLQLRKVA